MLILEVRSRAWNDISLNWSIESQLWKPLRTQTETCPPQFFNTTIDTDFSITDDNFLIITVLKELETSHFVVETLHCSKRIYNFITYSLNFEYERVLSKTQIFEISSLSVAYAKTNIGEECSVGWNPSYRTGSLFETTALTKKVEMCFLWSPENQDFSL